MIEKYYKLSNIINFFLYISYYRYIVLTPNTFYVALPCLINIFQKKKQRMGSSESKNEKQNPEKSQKQVKVQKQERILDQHYSNSIMMISFSTIEELIRCVSKNTSGEKMFGLYDKTDYSGKSREELKSQLQTHLFIMKTSKEMFSKDHGNNSYQLPSSFGLQQVEKQGQQFKKQLERYGEKEGADLCEDLINIVKGKNCPLSFENKNFSVQYSEKDKKQHLKHMFKDGIKAQQMMEQEAEKVKSQNIQDAKDLPVYIKNKQKR